MLFKNLIAVCCRIAIGYAFIVLLLIELLFKIRRANVDVVYYH